MGRVEGYLKALAYARSRKAPSKHGTRVLGARKAIRAMQVGDVVEAPHSTALSYRGAACWMKGLRKGWDYSSKRSEDGSIRIWRTA